MARKPAPTKAHEKKKPTPTATKAIEPKPTFIINGAPVTATALRPWTDAEKRLPLWLRANGLPRHVADPVEQVFLKDELPAPLANLWAMVHLARGAECGILTVRRDHGTKPNAMDPAVFVQNVVFMLRSARDDVLKQTAAANIPVVSARLDALIAATKATLDAFMAEQLDRIWCDNPTCDNRGRHLLPGPWIDAMKRSGEASEEAFRPSTFVGGDTTPTVSVSPDLLDRLQRAAAAVDPHAIDRAAERAAEKMAHALGGNGNAATKALPARTEVVLWEGAAHTDRNIRLARTRSAYLEAHGYVPAAMAALKDSGNPVARSTFYNHLDALDAAIPRWRESVQLSNPTGNLDGMRNVGTRGKSRGKVR